MCICVADTDYIKVYLTFEGGSETAQFVLFGRPKLFFISHGRPIRNLERFRITAEPDENN